MTDEEKKLDELDARLMLATRDEEVSTENEQKQQECGPTATEEPAAADKDSSQKQSETREKLDYLDKELDQSERLRANDVNTENKSIQ